MALPFNFTLFSDRLYFIPTWYDVKSSRSGIRKRKDRILFLETNKWWGYERMDQYRGPVHKGAA